MECLLGPCSTLVAYHDHVLSLPGLQIMHDPYNPGGRLELIRLDKQKQGRSLSERLHSYLQFILISFPKSKLLRIKKLN